MRITNKIIQNNQLSNINTNKNLQDTLSTQISSGKSIARPSDDPIVALRSLRLRTSVNQTSQYSEKNVEDAESWLTVTEDAITTLSDIISDIRQQYTKGTSDTLTVSDRQIIAENLEALADEIYNTGNVDFAGRSVFTGYRTSSTLTFQENNDTEYKITETEETLKSDTVSHTFYETGTDDETTVTEESITRLRLAYNNLKSDGDFDLTYTVTDAFGNETIEWKQAIIVSSDASPDPYETVRDNPSAIVAIPETGEILVGSDVASELENATDITMEYSKNSWNKGDLRPEHYFDCEDVTNSIVYDSHDGEIEYNVGVNQTLRINTTAGECFTPDIARDVEDILNVIKEADDIDSTVSSLTSQISATTDETELESLNAQLDAAKKAQTYINAKLHTMFSDSITKADDYLDANNLALTDCGTRSKRLELIKNRLDTQLSSLKELKSENEDVDLAETAIQLSSAEYSYDAALMAAGKILKASLLDYI